MPIVSSGQITITDISDAPVLNAFITASSSVAQTYRSAQNAWTPNYAANPLSLTLNLTKPGTNTSLLSNVSGNVVWTRVNSGVAANISSTRNTDSDYMSGTKNSVYTTKTNVPATGGASKVTASGNWQDPVTGLLVPFSATIDLTCVQLGETATIANFYTGQGGIFYNAQPATLTVNADLYKGSGLSGQNKRFKFFIADSSVLATNSAGYDSDGGIGWKLISANGDGFALSSTPTTNTTAQGILTVAHTAITNYAVFKVVVIDVSDSSHKYTGIVTLLDYTDPITITIESTAGNMFKNSQGQTTLTCRLFQSGNEVDTAGNSGYTYKWTKRNQNGVMDSSFGGANNQYKQGKSITVNASEIQAKAVFTCEVHK